MRQHFQQAEWKQSYAYKSNKIRGNLWSVQLRNRFIQFLENTCKAGYLRVIEDVSQWLKAHFASSIQYRQIGTKEVWEDEALLGTSGVPTPPSSHHPSIRESVYRVNTHERDWLTSPIYPLSLPNPWNFSLVFFREENEEIRRQFTT